MWAKYRHFLPLLKCLLKMSVYLFPLDGAMSQQVQELIKLNCLQSILSLFSGEVSVKAAVRIPNAGAKEIRLMWGLTVRTLQ